LRKVQAQGIQGADLGSVSGDVSFDPALEELSGGSMASAALNVKVGETAREQLMMRMLGVYLSRNDTANRMIASLST